MATQDNQMAFAHTDPLNVLPAVVWEVLLEKMENDDMVKVSRSIPALEEFVDKGRLFKWHVAQVLPLLIPKHLNTTDALNCRQVCKHWRDVVDTTLETHPDWLPYKSERLDKMNEEHVNYSRLPYDNFDSQRPTTWLSIYDDAMPEPHNPFPGRRVSLRVPDIQDMNEWITPQIELLGQFIRYFSGVIFESGLFTDAMFHERRLQPLLQCLRYMPNLKSLHLYGNVRFERQDQAGASREQGTCVALMPFILDTLDLQELSWDRSPTCFDTIIRTVVNHDGIEKLTIDINDWQPGYGQLFPNLREIFLQLYVGRAPTAPHIVQDSSQVANLLLDLKTANLKKITLGDATFDRNVENVLGALAPFNLESIHLRCRMEQGNWKSDVCLESVQDFCLFFVEPNDSLQFIVSFPSLKTLRLQLWGRYWEEEELDDLQEVETPLQASLRNFYFSHRVDWNNWSCFWDQFPNLQMLTIFTEPSLKPCFTHQYARECPANVFTPLGQRKFNKETSGYLM